MAVGHTLLDGRYELLSVLGEGGMGRAYYCHDHKYNAPVVVKAMHERFIRDSRFHELFRREMQFLSQFQHPNVVSLLKTGVDEAIGPFLVMEYLNGSPLGDILDQTPVLNPKRVVRLVVQMCKALQAAHNRGIIHRDIKPNNMMVLSPNGEKEQLKVLDFGLAKLAAAPHLTLEELKGHNRTLRAVGTPEYMNPEQMRGNQVDHRADFYSVGVMVYEMLTGRRPFDHPNEQELMAMHMKAQPPTFKEMGVPPNTINPDLEAAVMACLSKYPMDRPRSARDLAQRFANAIGYHFDPSAFEEPKTIVKRASSGSLDEKLADSKDTYKLEAWMPESIAIMKVRSFLGEVFGEVVESVPGLVKMRLWIGGPPAPPPPPGFMAKLGLAKPPSPPPKPPQAELDLHMARREETNQLDMFATMRKPNPCPDWLHPKWKTFVDNVINALCSHLMATKVDK
jgi:eukaryotic-like serine/threonine-protein kinase